MNPKPILILAPMRGLTGFVFRNVFHKHFSGIDLAVAPFVPTVIGDRIKDKVLLDLLPERNRKMPVIPQVIGKSPEEFIVMAKRLSDMGYSTVNWNLGCPYPMVAKKGRGSGMLPHPDRIDAFLDAVIPEIPVALSIKSRLGRYHSDEIRKLIPVFNRYPLTEWIIHPRTGVQMYGGEPDLEMFEECLRGSAHPVVYNGDIRTFSDFQGFSKRFSKISRWMLGRGVIADPFLPDAIQKGNESFPDRIRRFRDFHNDLFDGYREILSGPAHPVERMKSYWGYFAKSFENGEGVRKKVNKTKNPEGFLSVTENFLRETAQWRESRTPESG